MFVNIHLELSSHDLDFLYVAMRCMQFVIVYRVLKHWLFDNGGRRSLYKSCHYFLFYPNYFTHCLYLYSLWCEEIFWELLYLFHYFCSRFFWSPLLHSFAPDGNKYTFFQLLHFYVALWFFLWVFLIIHIWCLDN